MSHSLKILLIICTMCTPFFLGACSSRNAPRNIEAFSAPSLEHSAVLSTTSESVKHNGQSTSAMQGDITTSLAMNNQDGSLTILKGQTLQEPNAQFINARELKLKVRELADQIFNDMDNTAIQGKVAIPVAFADQENLSKSSPFGRLVAELLFYELNQRGIATKEMRNSNTVNLHENSGSSFFQTQAGERNVNDSLVIAGTYYKDRDVVFINAKLITPANGNILRTGNLVLNTNNLTTRMLAQKSTSLSLGTTQVKKHSTNTSLEQNMPSPLNISGAEADVH